MDIQALPALIRLISGIDGIRIIRILYCYAEGITEELIHEMRDNPKVAHYIEMPIQHSNDAVLKRMNRRDTKQKITKSHSVVAESYAGYRHTNNRDGWISRRDRRGVFGFA